MLSVPCFMNGFFCKTLSCHFFFHCTKVNGLFFSQKKVFLNVIFNGKKAVGLRKRKYQTRFRTTHSPE